MASTRARSLPVRMASVVMRPPRTAPRASMMIDFPAPVSPVSTFSPAPKGICTASNRAKFRIASSCSMGSFCATRCS